MTVRSYDGEDFEFSASVLIVGAGACGLTAALAAADAGADVLVLEREPSPSGTTGMSSGLIPAATTKAQHQAGVDDDSVEIFVEDLIKKTGGELDRDRAMVVCSGSTRTIDWLIESHSIPLTLFKAASALPGHSKSRLHGTPNRTGEELIAALQSATVDAGVNILTDARVVTLLVDKDKTVVGVEVHRPDGNVEQIGCKTLILASCGFASNRELVDQYIPEIAGINSHTHPGAQGDALIWGQMLGAATGDLQSYQGHANVAAGQGLLVSWLALSEGGIQLNSDCERFADESRGYSEQAADVAKQPDAFAWTIYDSRIDQILQEIAEYRDVLSTGAVIEAQSIEALAEKTRLPVAKLTALLSAISRHAASGEPDALGRVFSSEKVLVPPFKAVKVNPALFHTQGGLEIDAKARVLDQDGKPLPNLFAGGGAARGLSGSGASGYVAGNGLMTATTLGRLAGETAAAQALQVSLKQP